jgi:hypothetical protein
MEKKTFYILYRNNIDASYVIVNGELKELFELGLEMLGSKPTQLLSGYDLEYLFHVKSEFYEKFHPVNKSLCYN